MLCFAVLHSIHIIHPIVGRTIQPDSNGRRERNTLGTRYADVAVIGRACHFCACGCCRVHCFTKGCNFRGLLRPKGRSPKAPKISCPMMTKQLSDWSACSDLIETIDAIICVVNYILPGAKRTLGLPLPYRPLYCYPRQRIWPRCMPAGETHRLPWRRGGDDAYVRPRRRARRRDRSRYRRVIPSRDPARFYYCSVLLAGHGYRFWIILVLVYCRYCAVRGGWNVFVTVSSWHGMARRAFIPLAVAGARKKWIDPSMHRSIDRPAGNWASHSHLLFRRSVLFCFCAQCIDAFIPCALFGCWSEQVVVSLFLTNFTAKVDWTVAVWRESRDAWEPYEKNKFFDVSWGVLASTDGRCVVLLFWNGISST